MDNFVQQTLRILGGAMKSMGEDYITNFQSLINDANEIRENVTKTAKDSVSTYNKLRRTNLAKTISDWFYEREAEADQEADDTEFDAGFKIDNASSDSKEEEKESTELNKQSMQTISSKQTSAMYKIGHKQVEQSMVNASEIITSINTHSTNTLAAIGEVNKSVIAIGEKLDKLLEMQTSLIGGKKEEKKREEGKKKAELFDSNGHFRLAGAFNTLEEGIAGSDIAGAFDMVKGFYEAGITPTGLAKMGLEKLANIELDILGNKSINDLGNKFNESIAEASDAIIGKVLNTIASNDWLVSFFGDPTQLRNADTNYSSKVKNHYNTEKAEFDGMTRHSIIHVIPEYLKKITESVSGKTWNVTEKGELSTATPTNQFDRVARRAYQYGGIGSDSIKEISENLKKYDSNIKSDDVQKASKALMGVISMDYHNSRRRMISVEQITEDTATMQHYAAQAADMLVNSGFKGSKTYWQNVCMTLLYRLTTNASDASSFRRTVNQNVDALIKEASNFAKSTSVFSGQARSLTTEMMRDQFKAEYGPKKEKSDKKDENDSSFINSVFDTTYTEDGKAKVIKTGEIDKNNNIIGNSKDDDLTIKDYTRGIFALLNRGINVKVTNFDRGKHKDYYKSINIRQRQTDVSENRSDVIADLAGTLTNGLSETLNGNALLAAAGGKTTASSAASTIANGLDANGIRGGLGAAGNLATAGLMGILMGAGKGIGTAGMMQIIQNIKDNGGLKGLKDTSFGALLNDVNGIDKEALDKANLTDKTIGEYANERKEAVKKSFDEAKEKVTSSYDEIKGNVKKKLEGIREKNAATEENGIDEVTANTEDFFNVEDPDSLKGRAQTLANEKINASKETLANIQNSTAKSRHRISMALFGDGKDHKSMGEGISKKAAELKESAINKASEAADKGLSFIEDATSKDVDTSTLGGKFREGADKTKDALGKMADTSKKILGAVGNGFKSVTSVLAKFAKALAKLATSGLNDLRFGFKNLTLGLFGSKGTKTEAARKGLLSPLIDTTKFIAKGTINLVKSLKGWGKSALGFIGKSFKNVFGEAGTWLKDKLGIAKEGIESTYTSLNKKFMKTGFAKKADEVKEKVKGAKTWFENTEFGKNFVRGFKESKAVSENLMNQAETVTDKVNVWMKDMFTGKNSEWKENGPLGIIAKLLEDINASLNKEEPIEEETTDHSSTDTTVDTTSTDASSQQETSTNNDQQKSSSPDLSNSKSDTTDGGGDTSSKSEDSGGDKKPSLKERASNFISSKFGNRAGVVTPGSVGNAVKGMAASASKGIQGALGSALGGITQMLGGILKMIAAAVMGLSGFKTLTALVQSIITDGVKPLNTIFKRLTKLLRPLAKVLTDTLNVIATAISDILESVIDVIQPIIEAIGPIVTKICNVLLVPLLNIVTTLVDVIMVPLLAIVKYAIEPALKSVMNSIEAVKGVIQTGVGLLLTGIGEVVAAVGTILKAMIGSGMAEKGQEIAEKGQAYMQSGITSISNAVTTQISNAKEWWKDIKNGIDVSDMGTQDIPNVSGQFEPSSGGSVQDGLAGSGDTITNNYNYYYGSGNSYVTSQNSYGNTMNMSERGCGPTALADAYNRRTGSDVSPLQMASWMSRIGSGNAYEADHGTSVGGFINASQALGMNTVVGGVSAKSLKRATPNNPITLLGSGTDFGTKYGNNHYVNVVGTDKNGNAYVSNPISGRIERHPASSLAATSVLGIYGTGDSSQDTSYATKIAMNADTRAALDTLKDYQSQVFKYFSGESESDRVRRQLDDQEQATKAEGIKANFSEEEYQSYYNTAYALFSAENPRYDGENDKTYQKRFERNLYKYLQKAGATDDLIQRVTDEYNEMESAAHELDEAQSNFVQGMQSEIESVQAGSMWTSMNGGKQYGRFVGGKKSVLATDYSGDNGGESYRYEPIIKKTNIGESDTDEFLGSNIHEFFYRTTENQDVTKVTTKDGGWFKNRSSPSSTGKGSSGDKNYGIDIEFEGNPSPTISATTDGVVLNVGKNGNTNPFSNGGDGNYVQIVDADGNVHTYAYLKDAPMVERNQKVEGGQPIGVVGNTGLGSAHKGIDAILGYRISKPKDKVGKDFSPSTEDADQINPLEYFGLQTFVIPNQVGSSVSSDKSATGGSMTAMSGTLGQIDTSNQYLQSGVNTFNKYYASKNFDNYFAGATAAGIVPEAQAQLIGMQIWEDGARKYTGEKSLTRIVSDNDGQLAYGIMNWIPPKGMSVGQDCHEHGDTLADQLKYVKKAYYSGSASTSQWAQLKDKNYNASKAMGAKILGHDFKLQPGQYWGDYVNQDLLETSIHFVTHPLQPGGSDSYTNTSKVGQYVGSAAAAWNWMLANGKVKQSSPSATNAATNAITGTASPSAIEAAKNTNSISAATNEATKGNTPSPSAIDTAKTSTQTDPSSKLAQYQKKLENAKSKLQDTAAELTEEQIKEALGTDYDDYMALQADKGNEVISNEEESEIETLGIDSKGVFFLQDLPGSALVSLMSGLSSVMASSGTSSSGYIDSSSGSESSEDDSEKSTSDSTDGEIQGPLIGANTSDIQDYHQRKAFQWTVTNDSNDTNVAKAVFRTRLRQKDNYDTATIENGKTYKNFDSLWDTLKSSGSLTGIGADGITGWKALRQSIRKHPSSYKDSNVKTKVLSEGVNNGNIWTSSGDKTYQFNQKTDFSNSELMQHAIDYYRANKKLTSGWDDGDWARLKKYATKNSLGNWHYNNQTLENAATSFTRIYAKVKNNTTSTDDYRYLVDTFGMSNADRIINKQLGLGNVSSEMMDAFTYDPTAEIPKIDMNKLDQSVISQSDIQQSMINASNSDYSSILPNIVNDDSASNIQNITYVIEKDYTKEDKILDALGSYTFEVRARKVEELLETIITKMDQTTTPITKNTISNDIATPNLFPNNAIPESITRLSKG